jgi:hypothetical protein
MFHVRPKIKKWPEYPFKEVSHMEGTLRTKRQIASLAIEPIQVEIRARGESYPKSSQNNRECIATRQASKAQ